MLQIGFFDPVEFITAVTDMSTWSFPYDALTAGISGTVDWLKEEEHLFLSPVPTVPRSRLTELPKDGSVTEFFPGAVLPFDSPESFESYGQAGEIYLEKAPSDYSPQGYEEKENVYQYQANQWVLPAPHFSAAPRQLQFAYSVPVTPPVSQTPPNTPFDDFSPPRKPLGSINNKSRVEEKKECANCKTTTPSMWRWNYRGERECNACCLFETHNGMKRPPSRWSNNPMKRRKRRIAKADLKEEDESTRYSPY